MTREEFADLRAKAGMDIPMFRRLTKLSRSGAYGMGRDWPVQPWAVALVTAWYLMDGPKRQELLSAIEGTGR